MRQPELPNTAAPRSTGSALLREGAARLAGAAAEPGHATGNGSDPAATARLDAEVLLAELLGSSRAALLAHPERGVAAAIAQRYRKWIARRAAGEPLAYLTGRKEFWSLELHVTPAVLVPRPETELLVERALALGSKGATTALDLGTGSGAIAIALACERAEWQLTALDRSPEALEVARRNAARLCPARIEFVLGNWFAPLTGRRFTLLIANPPYIAADDLQLTDAPLRHEPLAALTAGADGLEALRAIIVGGSAHLDRAGWLLLEHGAGQAAPVRALLEARGFARVRSHRDLAGHERVIEAQWPHG